jgi:hypothetical protein
MVLVSIFFLVYSRFVQSIPDKEAGYRAASKSNLQARHTNDSDDDPDGKLFHPFTFTANAIHSRR